MAMTAAERQARYRKRALKDPDGLLLTRINTMISPRASIKLQRLQKVTGLNQRECIEQAIEWFSKQK